MTERSTPCRRRSIRTILGLRRRMTKNERVIKMSMLDDAADETKDAIKEAQRQRQGADDAPGAAMPLSAVAGEVGDVLTGAPEDVQGDPGEDDL